MLVKYPNSSETIAHQDFPFWPMETPDAISCWIPLTGANMKNGTLGFVPGSHLMKIYEFTDIVNNTKHNILDHPLVKNIKPVYRFILAVLVFIIH